MAEDDDSGGREYHGIGISVPPDLMERIEDRPEDLNRSEFVRDRFELGLLVAELADEFDETLPETDVERRSWLLQKFLDSQNTER